MTVMEHAYRELRDAGRNHAAAVAVLATRYRLDPGTVNRALARAEAPAPRSRRPTTRRGAA